MLYIAVGLVAAIAIALIVFQIAPSFNHLFISESPKPNAQSVTPAIQLSLDKVNVNRTSDTATVQLDFAAHNAGKNTAILQTIQYGIFLNGTKIASGAIGKQSEDVISGQANVYPILADATVHLNDIQSLNASALASSVWDSIASGKASYVVKGIYLYRDNTNLQAEGIEKDFELAYPTTAVAAAASSINQNNSSAGGTMLKLVQIIPLPNATDG